MKIVVEDERWYWWNQLAFGQHAKLLEYLDVQIGLRVMRPENPIPQSLQQTALTIISVINNMYPHAECFECFLKFSTVAC